MPNCKEEHLRAREHTWEEVVGRRHEGKPGPSSETGMCPWLGWGIVGLP